MGSGSTPSDRRPLHILCYLHAADLGGVERAARRLCGAWAECADVTLALGRADGWHGEAIGCAVRVAPRPPLSPRYFEALWMMLWLPLVVWQERPDVIFCAGNTYTVVAVFLKLLFGARCPPVVAKVSNSLLRPDMPAPVRLLYDGWCRLQGRALDHVVAMSPAMAREATGALAVPPGQVTMIRSPAFSAATLDRLTAHPPVPRRRDRLFVAIGRLEPQKNLALLLHAFAQGAWPEDRLAIVGSGSERTRLAALCEDLGLADRVTFGGHAGDVVPWLLQADALVLSSDYEGVPAVVLEAMAAGLPVIATDCCTSMAELLDERRGVLVPVRNRDALAAAIADRAAPLDREAQRRFARHHGVEEAAARYLTAFHRLARRRAIAGPHEEPAFP